MSRPYARSDPRSTTVHGHFEAGWRTRRLLPLPVSGPRIETPQGLWAAFSLRLDEDDRIAKARFDACSCTTLIAYCQVLTKAVADTPVATLLAWSAADLVGWLPGVPAARHDRAVLAIAALRAALPAERIDAY